MLPAVTSEAVIARVQPLTRTRAVRGPFDYRLSAEQADVAVGFAAAGPVRGQRSLGVVVELAERSELAPERLAEPEAVLGAGLRPDLVALAALDGARVLLDPRPRAVADARPRAPRAGPEPAASLVAELTAGRARARSATARPGSPTASGRC